jgi:glutathione synthase/RimK-type ligase-like ATP-grasp enzyme
MKVAYIGCQWSLISGTARRSNADDHDKEFFPAQKAFEQQGDELIEADWRGFDFAQHAVDLVFVRTAWDYVRHKVEFMDFLRVAEETTKLANSAKIINWNVEKYYLQKFAAMGLPVIPSFFPDESIPILAVFEHFQADEIVVKPVLGEGGYGMQKYRRAELAKDSGIVLSPGFFAQPMMSAILSEGEISMVFIGGDFSHAVLKQCAPGEYRVQTSHGGIELAYAPAAEEITLATQFVRALPDRPLACRVDLVRSAEGLLLMEVEAIEPILYPHFLPDFGSIIHQACRHYIA